MRSRTRLALAVVALLATLLVPMPDPVAAEEEVLAFPNPEEFVTQQYLDFLARGPDAGGLAFWAAQLRSGVHPGALVEFMVSTPEFSEKVAPVVRLYKAHFRRSPDFGGLQFWAGRFRNGMSLNAISAEFARSDEFVRTYGSLDDVAFVDLVYRNVFDRLADAGGKAYWLDRLSKGLSRGAMMVEFSESPEYVGQTNGEVRATMLYLGMLRRAPDPSGLVFWADYIDRGERYGNAIAGFLASDEYRERIRRLFPNVLPLTGEASRTAVTRPALVLKIDNHQRARPQAGINHADLVWEELVEGSITRLAAVYHEQTPARIGPVRSARTGDIPLVSQLNTPLFGASGANSGVLAALATAPVVNVNALVAGGYTRDNGRRAPHNLFANPQTLWTYGQGVAGTPPQLLRYRAVGAAAAGTRAAGVDIDFGNTAVTYRWNGAGWLRTQNGTVHRDSSGRAVAPPNVIVQITSYGISGADAESPEAITVGAGVAHIYTGGNLIEGTWSRSSATERIVYRDAGGAEVLLTPGRTWVAIAPPGTVTPR
jgi:hypothetical protein